MHCPFYNSRGLLKSLKSLLNETGKLSDGKKKKNDVPGFKLICYFSKV
jgi:hypothetical protein